MATDPVCGMQVDEKSTTLAGIGREHGKYGFHGLCQIKVISA